MDEKIVLAGEDGDVSVVEAKTRMAGRGELCRDVLVHTEVIIGKHVE